MVTSLLPALSRISRDLAQPDLGVRASGAGSGVGTFTCGIVSARRASGRQASTTSTASRAASSRAESTTAIVRVERVGNADPQIHRAMVGIDRQVEVRAGRPACGRSSCRACGPDGGAHVAASEPRSAARAPRRRLPSPTRSSSFAIASMRAMRACCARDTSRPAAVVLGARLGHRRQPFAGRTCRARGRPTAGRSRRRPTGRSPGP